MTKRISYSIALALGVFLLADCGSNSSSSSLVGSPVQPLRVATDHSASRLYVTNFINNTITVYDAKGEEETTVFGWEGLTSPTGIWTDGRHFWVTNYGASGPEAVNFYNKNGKGPRFHNRPRRWWGVNHPLGITQVAYTFYITDNGDDRVTAYSSVGKEQMLSGSWSGLDSPNGIAYDPRNGFLYVANEGNSTVTAYDQNGNEQSLPGSWSGLYTPQGIAYDPTNRFLYVTNANSTVTAYDQNGKKKSLSGSFPGLNGPRGIAYDPYNGFIYVANYGNSTITAYDQNGKGKSLSGSFPGLDGPYGIAIRCDQDLFGCH